MVDGGGEGVAAEPNAGLAAAAPPPFLSKTYEMVDDRATDAVVSWGPGNNSFVVWNTPEFAKDLLPKYFKHKNFSSFVRQLNTYGFRKVDPDRWEFANEGFLRGQKHLLKTINRRKPSQVHSMPPQPQSQNASVAACVEVGKFGLEEEIERLKRDKTVLMKELVLLRQQQQATDHQLQTVGQRLQGMEQRQQQMMSFLAKAMQSPGFLAQLVQQNDASRRITAGSKKRRLPEHESKSASNGVAPPDSHIVKFQPLINEAAKSMLMQILKMDTSSRMDSMGSNGGGFLIQNLSSPELEPMDSTSSIQNSRVTLSEVPTSSGIPAICSPPSEILESAVAAVKQNSLIGELPAAASETIRQCQTSSAAIPEFFPLPGVVYDGGVVEMPSPSYMVHEAEGVYTSQIPDFVDGQMGINDPADFSSPEDGINIDFDGDEMLPDVNDAFWEQLFLAASPAPDEVGDEDVDSGVPEPKVMQPRADDAWYSVQDMVDLTEQIGQLA